MAANMFEKTVKTLLKIGGDIEKQAKFNLRDHHNTGRLERKTQARLIEKAGEYKMQIVSLAYGDVLDKGLAGSENYGAAPYKASSSRGQAATIRGNTVKINWRDIKKWAQRKGIQNSYLVHMKLLRQGYPAKRWFTKAKENTLKNEQYVGQVAESYRKDVLDNIRRR